MKKTFILSKNAYLKVLVEPDRITSQLAYSHFDIGRSYILKDSTILTSDSPNKIKWQSYFSELENKLSWQILGETVSGVKNILPCTEEGVGLNGITVLVSEKVNSFGNVVMDLRTLCPDISVEIVNNDYIEKMLRLFLSRMHYRKILFINASLHNVKVLLYENTSFDRGISSAEEVFDSKKFTSKEISYDKLPSIISDSKLNAFVSKRIKDSAVADIWADYIFSHTKSTENPIIKDIIRAYLTIQLLNLSSSTEGQTISIFNQHPGVDDYAVFVTGDLVKVLDSKQIFLSVLDGLQLHGIFDLFVDTDSLFYTYLSNCLKGTESEEIILSKRDFMVKPDKVIIPAVPAVKNQRKVFVSGTVTNEKIGVEPFYSLSPIINSIELPEGKSFVDCQMVNGAYLKEYEQRINFVSDPLQKVYKKVITDCRKKPVVYGHDFNVNRNNLSNWFDE